MDLQPDMPFRRVDADWLGMAHHLHTVDLRRDGRGIPGDPGTDLVPVPRPPKTSPRIGPHRTGMLFILVQADQGRRAAERVVPHAATVPDSLAKDSSDGAAFVVVDQALVGPAILGATQKEAAVRAEVIVHLQDHLEVRELLLRQDQSAISWRVLGTDEDRAINPPMTRGRMAADLAVRATCRGLPSFQRSSIEKRAPTLIHISRMKPQERDRAERLDEMSTIHTGCDWSQDCGRERVRMAVPHRIKARPSMPPQLKQVCKPVPHRGQFDSSYTTCP